MNNSNPDLEKADNSDPSIPSEGSSPAGRLNSKLPPIVSEPARYEGQELSINADVDPEVQNSNFAEDLYDDMIPNKGTIQASVLSPVSAKPRDIGGLSSVEEEVETKPNGHLHGKKSFDVLLADEEK